MSGMRFGVFLPTGDLDAALAAARRAEADGFYSVSTNDHFYSPLGEASSPQLECFTALTAVAMATERVRIVPAVAAASFRSPALLAKICSTLDIVSNGRFICGLGAGWQDTEYLNHGYRFPPLAERLEQLDETIQVLKAMFEQEQPSFRGRHFEVREAWNQPRPRQAHVPIMLGGSGTGLLRIAAREADVINLIPPTGNGRDFVNDPAATRRFTMERLAGRVALLHDMMREAGRDPRDIELGGLSLVALSPDENDAGVRALAEQLGFEDYAAAQASPVALLGTPAEVREQIARQTDATGVNYYILFMASPETQTLFVDEVMPHFRQA
ncbi:MAG: LLM class flavin-dependent oxidoreductase [Gammaproteobacteria bacterium]